MTELESVVVEAENKACLETMEDPIGNAHLIEQDGDRTNYYRYVDGLGTISYTPNAFLIK